MMKFKLRYRLILPAVGALLLAGCAPLSGSYSVDYYPVDYIGPALPPPAPIYPLPPAKPSPVRPQPTPRPPQPQPQPPRPQPSPVRPGGGQRPGGNPGSNPTPPPGNGQRPGGILRR